MNRLKKAPSSSFRCEKKTSSNCRFFRYRDSSSNDIGLDTDDRRLSSEDEYVAHIEKVIKIFQLTQAKGKTIVLPMMVLL
jgi:hypothetical protein